MNQQELMNCAICIVIGFLLYSFIQNGFCGKNLVEGYEEEEVGDDDHTINRWQPVGHALAVLNDPIFDPEANQGSDLDPTYKAHPYGDACKKYNMDQPNLKKDGDPCSDSSQCKSYGKWNTHNKVGDEKYSCYQNCATSEGVSEYIGEAWQTPASIAAAGALGICNVGPSLTNSNSYGGAGTYFQQRKDDNSLPRLCTSQLPCTWEMPVPPGIFSPGGSK